MIPNLMVTLWPSFPHFPRFADDGRLAVTVRVDPAKAELVRSKFAASLIHAKASAREAAGR